MERSKMLRMDNVGIVVESLDDAISFFTEIGLKLEGRATIEGEWASRVTGLDSQRVEIAMMVYASCSPLKILTSSYLGSASMVKPLIHLQSWVLYNR
jgi:hypothetical protein